MQEDSQSATTGLSVVDVAHVLQANYAFISGMSTSVRYHKFIFFVECN